MLNIIAKCLILGLELGSFPSKILGQNKCWPEAETISQGFKNGLPQSNFLSLFFLSHITLTIYNYLRINTYSLLKLTLLLCHFKLIEEIYCNIFPDIKYINLHCALQHLNLLCQSRKTHALLHDILPYISGVFQLLLSQWQHHYYSGLEGHPPNVPTSSICVIFKYFLHNKISI